jgi:hypothetical protein
MATTPAGSGWTVNIVWTDIYNGIPDTITFDGRITEIATPVTNLVAPPGSIAMVGAGTAQGSRAAWKECNPGITTVPSGTVQAIFTGIVAKDTITVAAYPDFDTPLTGVWAPPIAVPVAGGTASYPEDSGGSGDVCSHSTRGTISVMRFGTPPGP